MVNKRYAIPFAAALIVNIAYWGVVGNWFGNLKPPETPNKDLVINLDMGKLSRQNKRKKNNQNVW